MTFLCGNFAFAILLFWSWPQALNARRFGVVRVSSRIDRAFLPKFRAFLPILDEYMATMTKQYWLSCSMKILGAELMEVLQTKT